MVRPRAFLDFSVNSEPLGRVIFELFNDTVPITCENFRALCTGEKGLSASGNPLYYKNSIMHRSINNFMIQGGDFTKRSGTGGESIYGSTFADEDLSRPLDSEGLLCMANKGPNTNGSQFFITLRECPHLNGKHVVFGKVIRGYEEVVKKLAEVAVDEKDRPLSPIVISGCGELELRKPPAKSTKPSQSNTETTDRRRSRRSRSRSRSFSSEEGHRRRKKLKKKKDLKEEAAEQAPPPKVPAEETEEEYDARLEREEKERIEAERKKELERIKQKYESEIRDSNGIRFKGRGRMKFVDPEVNQRRQDYR